MNATALPPLTGIGLRAPHHERVARELPRIAWLEVHSENFFVAGGPQLTLLDRIRSHYPVSLHGVGLSIGSADGIDGSHLSQLAVLVERVQPAMISEHLCWGALAGRHSNDLLPLPYTEESLGLLIRRVSEVQERLRRRILIENISSYLRFACETIPEWEFLASLSRASGCGILLDVNNVYVNARNHDFDAQRYIAALPRGAIQEMHLAGHSVELIDGAELRIDTHSTRVCEAVWALYEFALRRFGPTPTLIEWDSEIPALEVLLDEAQHADRLLVDASA